MAEQIEIFNINFGDTIQSIEKLKAELKETKKLFEQAKPNTEEFNKYGSEVKRLDSTIKSLNGVTKENINALGGINTATKFAVGSYGELKQKIEAQRKALLELNVDSKEFADTQNELIKLQDQRIEIEKKIPSLFQERIKMAIDESNSLKQLRLDLKAAQAAALNGDGKAAQRVAELKDKIDDLKDSTNSLQGSGVERLNTSMGLLTDAFQNFDIDKIKTGFKGIGAAMSAIPLILLIEGIKYLIENFDKVAKFAKEMTGSFSATEMQVKSLTAATQAQTVVNNNLLSNYTNEIALLTAKGGHEKELIELKKKKIAIEITEAENSIRLNSAKVADALLNNSITDSLNNMTIAFFRKIGATSTADKLDALQAKLKKDRINEEQKDNIKAIQDAQIGIEASKTALLVLDIEYNKKLDENAKKANEDKKKKIKDYEDFATKISNDIIQQMENDNKTQEELDKKASDEKIKQKEVELDTIKKLEEQNKRDRVLNLQTELLSQQMYSDDRLAVKLELLQAEKENELSSKEQTEAEKANIEARYRQQQKELTAEHYSTNLQVAGNVISSIGELEDAAYQAKRAGLKKGSAEDIALAKEQFEMNKAYSIASALISGALAVINASATVPYLPLGVAAQVIAVATTAASIAKISSTEFSYFEGGFTQKGDPTKESYKMGNAQFHNDEYVVPSKVKNMPEAMPHISQLEAMRKGFSKSNISGFFDGGYTSRSASLNTMNSFDMQQQIQMAIASQPAPIVRVTDINNVSKSNSIGVNVSSL